MIAGIGATGFILIILVALILFGPKKLPELGRAVGSTLSEFKKGTKEIMDTDMEDNDKEQNNVKETTMTSASTEKTSN